MAQCIPEQGKGQQAAADYKRKLDTRVTVEGLVDSAVSGAITGNKG